MTNAGIDYGSGLTNVDRETGIRYGVISQHSVTQAWCDSSEADYGEPTCPKCGCKALDSGDDAIPPTEQREHWEYNGNDFACLACEYTFWSDQAYGDEPQGWSYDGDGYQLVDCLDSDIMVLKSDFYTFGNYCSPCVPGAVSLESDNPDGAKAYCLGHDWFEEGKAPYRVFRVDNDQEVLPEG